LLQCALTHRSVANERAHEPPVDVPLPPATRPNVVAEEDNERLEFLGDAVLGLVVAEAMFEAHPEWREGELTRIRAQLVSRKHLAEVAMAIGLVMVETIQPGAGLHLSAAPVAGADTLKAPPPAAAPTGAPPGAPTDAPSAPKP